MREGDGLDDQSLENLASSGTPATLTGSQRLAVEAIALRAARNRNGIRDGLDSPPISAFECLVRLVSERRLALTIETWEALANEPEHLQTLLAGLVLSLDVTLMSSQISRAIFENAALRHYVGEIARDDAWLTRIEEQVRESARQRIE